jgi:hypothetical protein
MVPTYRVPLFWLIVFFFATTVWSDDATAVPKNAPPELKGQVLILVGLPGDEEHEKLFATIVKQWRTWLTTKLGFQPGEIHVLFGKTAPSGIAEGPISREVFEKEAARLKQTIQPDDRLWVFFLGHANFDGEHALFHLPGPDLNEEEIGKLFEGINCREQIFWLTSSESGRFVKNLSAKGRIVIAATRASGEDNETEFPQALAALADRSLPVLDIDKDGKLSVLELYYRIMVEVQTRYAVDKRIATEHSQLDDNGDGIGVERPLAADEEKKTSDADGTISLGMILPYVEPPAKDEAAKKP